MTRSRFGLLGLLAGLLIATRALRREQASDPSAAHVDLLLVERDARRSAQELHRELSRVERHGRRGAALIMALVAVAVLPAIALATRPDLDPLAGAVVAGALGMLAIVALLAAARAR